MLQPEAAKFGIRNVKCGMKKRKPYKLNFLSVAIPHSAFAISVSLDIFFRLKDIHSGFHVSSREKDNSSVFRKILPEIPPAPLCKGGWGGISAMGFPIDHAWQNWF